MAGPVVSTTNYLDFLGETPEEEEERLRREAEARASTPEARAAQAEAAANQIRFENETAESRKDLPGSVRSIRGQQFSRDVASGARVVVPPPLQWGQFAASPEELARFKQEAIDARKKRDGGYFGDLLRLGTAGARTLVNPINAVIGDYLPEEAQAVIGGPGYFVDAALDEVADRVIPGGSGSHGENIIPGRAGTGGDDFYPSETIGSGSYRDGYRGVGNPRANPAGGAVAKGAGSSVQRPESYRSDQALAEIRAYLDAERNATGPSEAEALLNKATERAAARSLGIAAGARGGAGARERARQQALSANASLSSQASADLAALRAREENDRKAREANIMAMLGPLAQAGDLRDLGYTEAEIKKIMADNLNQLQRDEFNARQPTGLLDDPLGWFWERMTGTKLNSPSI